MFERFKKSRGTRAGATSVATRDREARADAPMDGTSTRDEEMDITNDRIDDPRFERQSPGERDHGVVAGGGEADLAADRAFERDEMARGTNDGDTALERDSARSDLDGGGVTPGADDRTMARDDMAERDDAAMRDRDDTGMRDDAAMRD